MMNALSTDINRLFAIGKTYGEIQLIHGVCFDTIKRALAGYDVRCRKKVARCNTKGRGKRAEKIKDSIDACPQDVLQLAESKPRTCSDARWRIELSRRKMGRDGMLEYAPPPQFLR